MSGSGSYGTFLPRTRCRRGAEGGGVERENAASLVERQRRRLFTVVSVLSATLIIGVCFAATVFENFEGGAKLIRGNEDAIYIKSPPSRIGNRTANTSDSIHLYMQSGSKTNPPTWLPMHKGPPPATFSPDCAIGGDDCCRWHWPGDPIVRQSSYHDLSCAHTGQAQNLQGTGRDCIAGFACRYCCAPPVSPQCANWRRSLDLTRAASICKNWPTAAPTKYPTSVPTHSPTKYPTHEPTLFPTPVPTEPPTPPPTPEPTVHQICYVVGQKECPSSDLLRILPELVDGCEQCAQACGKDPDCSYYTLVPTGLRQFKCELFKACDLHLRGNSTTQNKLSSSGGGIVSYSMEPGGGGLGQGQEMGGIAVGYNVGSRYKWWATAVAGPPLFLVIYLAALKSVQETKQKICSFRGLSVLLAGLIVAGLATTGIRLPYMMLLSLSVSLFGAVVVHIPGRNTKSAVFQAATEIFRRQLSWINVCAYADVVVAVLGTIWLIMLLSGAVYPQPHGVLGGQIYAVITIMLMSLGLGSAIWGAYPFCKPAQKLGWPASKAPPPLQHEGSDGGQADDEIALEAFKAFRTEARDAAWCEGGFPVLITVQIVICLIVDAIQRWPEVSVYRRALADAIAAVVLASFGASYFFLKASRIRALLSGLKWATASGSASLKAEPLNSPITEEKKISRGKKYKKFKVKVSDGKDPFRQNLEKKLESGGQS